MLERVPTYNYSAGIAAILAEEWDELEAYKRRVVATLRQRSREDIARALHGTRVNTACVAKETVALLKLRAREAGEDAALAVAREMIEMLLPYLDDSVWETWSNGQHARG